MSIVLAVGSTRRPRDAVIGAAAGLRYYWLAAGATALTLLVLSALDVLERGFGTGGRNSAGKPD